MRILIYGINFAPELTGIGKYTGEMAAWLASRGHEVRVVTAPPYYPAWKVSAPYSAVAYRRERWKGVEVWRCPLWVPTRPGGLKRLVHLASFAFTSAFMMLRQVLWRPDIVWTVEPAFFGVPVTLVTARLSGAKAWLHIQDYEVDAAFDLGLLKGERLKRFVLGTEAWFMRRFDCVSTISKRMLERAGNKGVAAARIRSFPNWVDIAGFSSSPEGVAAYRQELGFAHDTTVALYSGNMGGKQGLELLANLASLCPEVAFVFCGNGAGREDLRLRCANLNNVLFLDLQEAARLPDFLAMADIHLLPQRADAADLVMPSKLTGMLASGRPVVATAHPGTELADVVERCGIVVPPENAPAFAVAVRDLASNAPMRAQLGRHGLEFAQSYMDKDVLLSRFEKDLVVLVGNPTP